MGLEGKVAFVTGASRSGDDLGLPGALGLGCDVRDVQQVEDAVAGS